MLLISFRCGWCNSPITNADIVEDWGLEDPTGKEDEAFIETIQKIEGKILDLKNRLSERNL